MSNGWIDIDIDSQITRLPAHGIALISIVIPEEIFYVSYSITVTGRQLTRNGTVYLKRADYIYHEDEELVLKFEEPITESHVIRVQYLLI